MEEQLKHYADKLAFEIDSWDLKVALERGEQVTVIDARSVDAYALEHIPGAINVPWSKAANEDGTFSIQGGLTYYDVISGEGFSYEINAAAPSGHRIENMTYNGKAVQDRYGVTEKDSEKLIVKAWWAVLDPSIKELQKQYKIGEAQVVDNVLRRAIEPGNNFFSVPPAKVSEHLFLMSAMLIFYVLYTLWYGFAIFELFEGIGLAMTKSKVKQES